MYMIQPLFKFALLNLVSISLRNVVCVLGLSRPGPVPFIFGGTVCFVSCTCGPYEPTSLGLNPCHERWPIQVASGCVVLEAEVSDGIVLVGWQGGVWIAALPDGDVKKMYTRREKALKEKAAKEQKSDQENSSKESKSSKKDALKDYIHVAPVWRFAKLQGRILHLSCQGVKESILLEGCDVVAVSGSVQPGRKW